MMAMFYDCSQLKELNLSSFDTKNVNKIKGIFYSCDDINNFNLSSFSRFKIGEMMSEP